LIFFNKNFVNSNFIEVLSVVDDEIESYFGTPKFEDTSFFIAVLLMNNNFMTEPIIRPKLKSYRITHTYERVQTIQETYKNKYNSFLPLTNNMLMDLKSLGFYDPYDGKLINDEVVDSDYLNDWVDDIEEL
jgi:PKD repeat protein